MLAKITDTIVRERLVSAMTHARAINRIHGTHGLVANLRWLHKFFESSKDHVVVRLYRDFAVHSFTWTAFRSGGESGVPFYSGALIYSGPDAGETFSVSLAPYHGWSIHS